VRGSFSQFSDMYDLLEQVRLRPGMWVRGHSVRELETMLCGYSMALAVHDVPEYFELDPALGPFAAWLRETRHWAMAEGWAAAIEAHAGSDSPIELFFSLLDEYRSRPEAETNPAVDWQDREAFSPHKREQALGHTRAAGGGVSGLAAVTQDHSPANRSIRPAFVDLKPQLPK
jgi:hypothetical protein